MVASGLTSPRGMIWGVDDTIIVALAGSGGSQPATEDNVDLWTGGPTGAVASIDAAGCPVLVAGGLPSAADSIGGVLGAEDLAVLDGQLYVAVDGGGAVHGNPDQPSGVYIVYGDGSAELVADLSAWVRENPVAELPEDYDPDAAGYSMVADPDAGLLWVVDPNSGQILTVSAEGSVDRVADFSADHIVPTRLALNPDGGVYVGTLTASPFTEGEAKVMSVSADGTVSDVWTGLTAVADVAVGPDGTLYALEMSTGNLTEPPFLVADSGRLVQQTDEDRLEVIASGLPFPVALEIGPDDAFYVSAPGIGASAGEGVIMRIAPDGSSPVTEASADCEPLPETLSGEVLSGIEAEMPPEQGAVEEGDASTPVSFVTPESNEAGTGAPADLNGEVQVATLGFAYQPATIEIPAGTAVRWKNMDEVDHTATGFNGEFDTGLIAPGESATVTFDTPGTYVYFCQLHPDMQATIVVV